MHWKKLSAGVAAATLALTTATACSSSKNGGTSDKTDNPGKPAGSSSTNAAAGLPDPAQQPKSKVKAATLSGDCAAFSPYGSYQGKSVTMYASITDPEASYLKQSW